MSVLTHNDVQRWDPPATLSREQVMATSDAVLARPAGDVRETEDIFRLAAAAANKYRSIINLWSSICASQSPGRWSFLVQNISRTHSPEMRTAATPSEL